MTVTVEMSECAENALVAKMDKLTVVWPSKDVAYDTNMILKHLVSRYRRIIAINACQSIS